MTRTVLARRSFLCALYLMGGALGLSACGEEVTIRGKVPTASAQSRGARAVGVDGVDRIEAFPLEKGLILTNMLADIVSQSISDDGSFDITLDAGRDWMLVLVDSTQQGSQRFVSYVGATVSEDASLIALPLAGAGGADLDLGLVSGAGDTWTSDGKVESTTFNLDADTLLSLARVDASFKNLKNMLANFDGEVFYTATPSFNFGSPATPGEFNDPSTYTLHDTWSLETSTNDPSLTMDGLCGGSPPAHSLTSPESTRVDFAGYTCEDGPNGLRALGPDGLLGQNTSRDNKRLSPHLNLGWGFFPGEIPVGDFSWAVDDDVVATFDVAIARPVDDLGRPIGVVPSVRVNTSASGDIESLDLEWYVANASGGFTKVTDPDFFDHVITYVGVDIDVGGVGEQFNFDPRDTATLVPEQKWNVPNADPPMTVRMFVSNGGLPRQYAANL